MSIRPLSLRRSRCLLRQAQTNPDAFASFYDAYSRRVLLFFTWRVANAETAFDLMSETFAKALERREQFRGGSPEEEQGWLFAIARSELSHFWRRGAVERAALARLGVDVPDLSDAEIERIEELAGMGELSAQVRQALTDLPIDQRQAVGLRIVAEMSYCDIAGELGVSEDVVRARVSRGLKALRSQLPQAQVLLEERS